jgi:hypothetical protein
VFLSPFSANTTLRAELQDLGHAIAVCLTSEVRDLSDRQCFSITHNLPKILASRAADLALYPRRRQSIAKRRVSTKVTVMPSVRPLESVLASVQPSLQHLLPFLEELGVR